MLKKKTTQKQKQIHSFSPQFVRSFTLSAQGILSCIFLTEGIAGPMAMT